jgi:predicted PurR-regulated permease PerM
MSNSRVTPATIYRAVLLAFGLAVAGLIFEQLATVVLAVLIVVVIALPLSAFASTLRRVGIPRPIGVVLGLLLALAAVGGVIALLVPVITQEINQFVKALPSIVNELSQRLGRLTGKSPSTIGPQVQHFVDGYTQHPQKLLGPAAAIGVSIASVFAIVIVIVLTAVFSAIHPEPLVNGVLRIVSPARRPQAEQILSRLATAYLSWLRGLVLGMVVLGTMTYAGLQLAGIGFAAFFAVFTAVAMIIPYFGALISSIPPILYALTYSPGKAIVVAVIYIAAHQLESNIIQPLVVARKVHLHPAVVAVGVVAVDRLFGFVGLIVAVPILATIKILVEELWVNRFRHADRTFTGDLTASPTTEIVSVAGAPAPRRVGAANEG